MAAQEQKLFKFEDQNSIAFAIPEEVIDRKQLVEYIEDQGGRVTKLINEANFVILSAKVATKETLGLLVAQGCVVVDACWIWESGARRALQPWYAHRLRVDEVEIPAQERDINELGFSLARFVPLSGVEEIYLHLAKQFPHRTSRLFRSLHHENRKLVDFKVQELGKQIGMLRPRMESVAAPIPVNTTKSGAERVANIRELNPLNHPIPVVSGDDPEPAPTSMGNKDIIMDDTPGPVSQSPLLDVVVPDADEEMLVLPQQHLALPAATGPSVTSQSGRIQGRRKTGTGKFVSLLGSRSLLLPPHHLYITIAMPKEEGSRKQGVLKVGKERWEANLCAQEDSSALLGKEDAGDHGDRDKVLQFTSVTPPPDGGPPDSTEPDAKPIQHIMNGPRQFLVTSGNPWRNPLPGLRGRDNVDGRRFPDQLKEAFCRRPRKPLPDEDLSADPTDIEAMARYLLSHDQGFFDEFYVDYRDGYKRERWDQWFKAHKDAIRACGINLLEHSDFTWNKDRQNVRYHRTPNHIQPTWSEELTLNLTPFEEELLAKEWNPVKDLEYVADEPFCDYIAQQANTFLKTQSLTKAGYRLRPRWAFLWTKRGAAGNEIKRRTARQWEHRFQKNDRVGELIGLKPEEWDDNSDDERGCYCSPGSHP